MRAAWLMALMLAASAPFTAQGFHMPHVWRREMQAPSMKRCGMISLMMQGGDESLAQKLSQAMNSWSTLAPDSLPTKRGSGHAEQRAKTSKDMKPEIRTVTGGPKSGMAVRVSTTKAGKGGKTVTEIVGLTVPDAEAKALLKKIKERISVGGRVTPEGVLEVQGDQCDVVIGMLKDEGFTDTKRSGGGGGGKTKSQPK